MLAFFVSHPEVISFLLLVVSELLPVITKGDSTGITHLLMNTVKAVVASQEKK